MQTVLKQVIRRNRKVTGMVGNRQVSASVVMPVGVMIASKLKDKDGNDIVIIGTSKVNEKAGDVFDPYEGENVAIEKISDQVDGRDVYVPASIAKDADQFIDRCQRYFKDCNVKPIKLSFQKPL